MAVIWTDWNNGDSNLLLRTNLNSFSNSVVTDVNKNTTDIATVDGKAVTNIADIAALDVRTTQAEADIVVLENPLSTLYAPQAIAPGYVAGQTYYDSVTGTFDVQGAYAGVTLQTGREIHIEVINNSAGIILNGTACRHSGVQGGVPEIELAIATSFDNARVLGIATHDIAIGAKGIITTFGVVGGLDTLLVPTGVPLYLSATVAGTYTSIAPSIITRIGGALTADAIDGQVFAFIINNTSLPTVFGGLQGQISPIYALTTIAQDIINYSTAKEVVVNANVTTGEITLPNTGEYRMNFTSAITFTSLATTRSVIFELYDVTNTLIHFSYVKNIPRDATQDSISFSWPLDELINNVHKMRVKANAAMNITFDSISFDIESVNIR